MTHSGHCAGRPFTCAPYGVGSRNNNFAEPGVTTNRCLKSLGSADGLIVVSAATRYIRPLSGSTAIVRAPTLVATLATLTNVLASLSSITERVPSPLELKMSLRLGSKAAASDLAPMGRVATVAPVSASATTSTLFAQLEKRRCVSGSRASPCGLVQLGIAQWASI